MVEKSISPALARCFWLGAFGMLVGLVLLTVHFRRSRKNEDDDVVDDAGQPDTDTDSNLSTSTTDFITTTTTTDPSTASLSSMPHPHSSGDRSHDTIRQVTGHVTRQVSGQVTASGDDLTTAMAALSSGGILSRKHAELLVSLLSTDDSALLQRVLVNVANAAAFTSNQNTLRDAGCLSHLSRLLHTHLLCVTVGQNMTHPTLVNGVVKAIGNLAVNEDNQAKIQDCIPALIQLTSSEKSSEDLQLASLQALTNLSVTSTYHPPYTKVIQQLYELLDVVANPAVRLQALKVLVNLSCNADMVPHLLAAKAPCCLIDLLHSDFDEDLLLRWLTILANISSTSRQLNITYVTLPTQYKAASPETMYTALYGLNNSAKLKSKVFVLSRHGNESVRCQATRIYSVLL